MSLTLPARRPLAVALTFAVVVGGLSLAPLSATAATPTTAQNATTVLNAINSARAAASTEDAYIGELSPSAALTKIAQKYAADSAAKGKIVAEPTVIPAEAYPAESTPTFDITVGQISSKAKASTAYAKLDASIATNAQYDFAGVGYATKGTKTFVVALVADYATQPLETQYASVPKINGTVAVGRQLYATTVYKTPVGFSEFEWFVNGLSVSHGQSYYVSPADLGKTITVQLRSFTEGYADLSLTSKKTAKVVKTTPKFTIRAPYGNANVGQWLGADYSFGTSIQYLEVKYQWYRNGSKIADATDSSYFLTSHDKGKKVTVKVIAGGGTGFTTYSKVSKPRTIKAEQIRYATGVSYSQVTEGVATVGTVFSVNTGDWFEDAPQATATGPGITLKIQWLRDGNAITGATKNTYTVTKSDLDHRIYVKVSGSLKGYDTTVRYPDDQSPTFVAGAPFTKEPTYKQTGTFKTGKTLKVSVGNLMSGAKVTYAFYDYNSKKLSSKSSFTVSAAAYKVGGVYAYVYVTKAGHTNQYGGRYFGWSTNGGGIG